MPTPAAVKPHRQHLGQGDGKLVVEEGVDRALAEGEEGHVDEAAHLMASWLLRQSRGLLQPTL